MNIGAKDQLKARVVFVDDEPNVLQAMRRTLHTMRNVWDMEFVTSGAAALESLEKADADVIVTDMRMPGMDGWQLLAEVKKRHPQTVRLLLSGHADQSCIMRSVGTAHQYLAKPCDSETLKAAIVQTQMLRHVLTSAPLALLVGQVGLLPSAPKAFQELLACIQGPNASVGDAARIISRDLAMTANIMKLVNSAFFGSRQPITSADRAVAYLGLDTVGALVLGQCVFQGGVMIGIEGFSLAQLWRHSLQTATTAKAIAINEKLSAIKAEEAFLAGMLHDVGKIVFATRASAANGDLEISNENAIAQMEAHHAEVGAYLLGLWGFPNSIVEAVAFHHLPSHAGDTHLGLTGIVHIADRLAHQQNANGATPAELGIESGLLERLGLLDHLPQWSALLNSADFEQGAT